MTPPHTQIAKSEHTIPTVPIDPNPRINTRALNPTRMKIGLSNLLLLLRNITARINPRRRHPRLPQPRCVTKRSVPAHSSTLHRQRLAHDGAAARDGLQVAHCAAAGGGAGRGGEGAQGAGGGLFEEGAEVLGLVEEGLHDFVFWLLVWMGDVLGRIDVVV
jgi:hypothetical protein